MLTLKSGATLLRLYQRAVREDAAQSQVLANFKSSLDPETEKAWTAQAEAFESDPKGATDPYFREDEGLKLVSILVCGVRRT